MLEIEKTEFEEKKKVFVLFDNCFVLKTVLV
jgi:hypothetical protein